MLKGFLDIRKYSFSICVDKDSTFEVFKEELNLVLEHFDYNYVDDNGSLIIDIFEDGLSETRNMALLMVDLENDKWAIDDRRYSRYNGDSYDYAPMALEKCFEVLRRSYYYTRNL